MPRVLVVADESWVRNEVHAALTAPGIELLDHEDPASAAERAVAEGAGALIVDLQVGAMGGMAITRSVRETTGDRESRGLPVVLLLDRSADGFLARRAGAAAWLTKPFTSHQLEAALDRALAGSAAEVDEDGGGEE
jgi:DNA-binding response OmpR family regulator